ncbi:hypothetical protein GALMADRAFT_1083886 [Galerina marginata CBS 339.88]|uniref:Uncharacterized protein n=1 Tax=Galerina marginata (strain CBS 339.88) TaxID=685588 RepID=A0A067S938_GALM3|nr:hypothetical protein GALMADRAFT_1083886 [Galerina marginata CBS 339.88]
MICLFISRGDSVSALSTQLRIQQPLGCCSTGRHSSDHCGAAGAAPPSRQASEASTGPGSAPTQMPPHQSPCRPSLTKPWLAEKTGVIVGLLSA